MPKSVFTPAYAILLETLVETRRRAGMTQAQLAEKLKRPQPFVSYNLTDPTGLECAGIGNATCSGDNPDIVVNGSPPGDIVVTAPWRPSPFVQSLIDASFDFVPPIDRAPQNAVCTPAGRSALSNPTKGPFIRAHAADAAAAARRAGNTTANILGLSALESGWGNSPFASHNNFFGQHYPQPGATYAFHYDTGLAAGFPNYAASAQSFAQHYGSLIRGVNDPAAFATTLQNSGAFGINPDGTKVKGYVSSTAATIRGVQSALNCL